MKQRKREEGGRVEEACKGRLVLKPLREGKHAPELAKERDTSGLRRCARGIRIEEFGLDDMAFRDRAYDLELKASRGTGAWLGWLAEKRARAWSSTSMYSGLHVEGTAWDVIANIATHQIRRLAPVGGPSCPYVSRETLQLVFAEGTLYAIGRYIIAMQQTTVWYIATRIHKPPAPPKCLTRSRVHHVLIIILTAVYHSRHAARNESEAKVPDAAHCCQADSEPPPLVCVVRLLSR